MSKKAPRQTLRARIFLTLSTVIQNVRKIALSASAVVVQLNLAAIDFVKLEFVLLRLVD